MDGQQTDGMAGDLTLLLTVGEWLETMMQELDCDSSELTSSRFMSKANLLPEACGFLFKQHIAKWTR